MIEAMTIDERRGCTSASNAAADSLCGARHLAQRGKPRVETEDAGTGRRIHEALATGKTDGLNVDERRTFELCLEVERKKLIEFFGDDAPKAIAFREDVKDPAKSRLWVTVLGPAGQKYEHSCRCDVIYRLQERALIIEYKTLFGEVPDSPRNLQLRDQQVLVRGNMAITGDIGVCVIQPAVTMDPQICVYTPDDSKRAEQQMFARVVASNDPSSQPVAGEVQCKFCLAKKSCKAYLQYSGALVPAMLTVLDVEMEQWTPEHRAKAMDLLKPAQDLLDLIKEFIRDGLAADPNFCPGYTLKPGAVIETITNPQGVFDRFTKLGGTLEQFMPAVRLNKTALKESLADLTGAKGKKLDAAMATLTDGFTESKRNSPSIKRIES